MIGVVRRRYALDRLAELAEDQAGYVTRAQAAAVGVDDLSLGRLVEGGDLIRVDHGVYRLRGAPAHEFEDLWVAWLRLDPGRPAWLRSRQPDAVVSHRSAARLYGLGTIPADVHEFTVTRRHQTRRPDVRLHHKRVGPSDWTAAGTLPVTTPQRIAADLLGDGADGGHVAVIVDQSLQRGLVDEEAMAAALGPYARTFGMTRGDGHQLVAYLRSLAASEFSVGRN